MSKAHPDPTILERRSGSHRRNVRSRPHLFSGYRRRKSKGRRKTDMPGYIDVYGAKSWGVVIFVLTLSFLDAILTALQIWSGSVVEANPVMQATISRGGIFTFFGVKVAMTALPLAFLLLHKEWKVARFAVWVCILIYALVSLYHIYLIGVHGSITGYW